MFGTLLHVQSPQLSSTNGFRVQQKQAKPLQTTATERLAHFCFSGNGSCFWHFRFLTFDMQTILHAIEMSSSTNRWTSLRWQWGQQGCRWLCSAGSGVDGVKVDVQATVGLMGSKLGGGPSMTLKYHQSLESSVQAAFPGNHCINCMCHSTENLYRCVSGGEGITPRSQHSCIDDDFQQTPLQRQPCFGLYNIECKLCVPHFLLS